MDFDRNAGSGSRLILATLSDHPSQAYDRYGNLLTKGGTTFCSPTCTNNQVTGGSFVRGNLTSYGGQSFAYDGLDRMTSSTQSSLTWNYLYDGSDERAAKIPPTGSWTYTIRDENKRVASEFSATTPSRDNVFLGNQLVASYANGGVGGNGPIWVFYSSDHLGTPRLLTDISANPVEPQPRRYWPYGESATTAGTFEALRFATMEFDAEGGTSPGLASDRYYDHARSHVGGLGRFLSPDQLLGRVSSPQTWNRYTYAGNNPIKYVDRTGLDFVLTGCNGGPEATCNQQKQLLQQTVGDKAYSYLSVGKDGKVTFNGITAGAFGKQLGVFGRALAGLVDSKSVFSLFTNNSAKAAMGGGAFTDVLKGGGANIYLNPSSFPKQVGGVDTSLAIAFAHEAGGHAAASLFPELRDAISSRTSNSVRTYLSGEGYSVTFENRYRQEVGADIRSYYLEPGDYIPPRPGLNLFPPSFP